MGRKTLKLQAVPTLNLPVKSHGSYQHSERRHINVVRDRAQEAKTSNYTNFASLIKRTKALKCLDSWITESNGNELKLTSFAPKN